MDLRRSYPSKSSWLDLLISSGVPWIHGHPGAISLQAREGVNGIFSLPRTGKLNLVSLEAPPSTVEGEGLLCISLTP